MSDVCRVLKIPRSTFYKNSNNHVSIQKKRRKRFRKLIKEIYFASRCRYGSPKIAKKLQHCGEKVSEKFIGNLMHELELYSIIWKKYTWHPKQQKIEERENIIDRDFSTKTINQKWATDITYIHTLRDGWLYLSSILDLHTKKIISWDLGLNMINELVLKTINRAVDKYKPSNLIIHTDLGSQYTSDDYNQRLTELHIRHSYSRKGCPYDNAPMESFHASLKKECVYSVPVFEDYETAAAVLFEYVHAFYNRKRIHSSLGYQTPLQVEIATLTSQMAA
ncbi:IS3 family transposase [Lactiplantibacillus pentosus]|uniref:IS3 family transposase n=1 Tax=Lactiplantibacillus pentosus TaxID=1589 RepID=UPI003D798E68